MTPLHRALPWSASEVREWVRRSSAAGYAYGLRARLPAEDFPAYAGQLGLTATAGGGEAVTWPRPDGPAEWWDPPPLATWAWQRDGERLVAAHRDGRLYVAGERR